MGHENHGGILKDAHEWTREGGYAPAEDTPATVATSMPHENHGGVVKDHHDWTTEGGYQAKAPDAAPSSVELSAAQKESLLADESAEKKAEEAEDSAANPDE